MARTKNTDVVDDYDAEDVEEKVKLDPDTAKCVRLLKEVAGCYRDAARALAAGDDTECGAQIEVADAILNVFNTLSKKISGQLTVDGLTDAIEG